MEFEQPPIPFEDFPPPEPAPAPDARPAPERWRSLVALGVVGGLVGGALFGVGLRRNDSSPLPARGTPASLTGDVDATVVDITTTLDRGTAAGTGMVLSSNGLVLTNNHVINGARSISVQIGGTGTTYAAHVIGYDSTDDVAVIQLEHASHLKTIAAVTSIPGAGTAVTAIGNALGLAGPHQVSSGTIVALDRTVTASEGLGTSETLTGMIETDAALQPGDSGGPLFDSAGKVVGMNTAASGGGFRFRQASTTSFAIPITKALSIARQIEAGKSSSTVHIGSRGILGVSISQGLTVAGVQRGGPADRAGIVEGDVITAVEGTSVDTLTELQRVLDTKKPGDTVKVTWTDADGASHAASLKLVAGPPA